MIKDKLMIEDIEEFMQVNKTKFLDLCNQIKRPGMKELTDWLVKTDFFTAPASTRRHASIPGGLCFHSLNVYERLQKLVKTEMPKVPEEAVILCALFHDVCKTDIYKTEWRNTKNEFGAWIKVPYYTIDDALPYGHGEKSVYILNGFLKLTRDEAMAINWHMGGFDVRAPLPTSPLRQAFTQHPFALLLHVADLWATYFDENVEVEDGK